MLITVTLRDQEDGQVEIEEVRLPFAGERINSETSATALADELRKLADRLSIQETEKIRRVA